METTPYSLVPRIFPRDLMSDFDAVAGIEEEKPEHHKAKDVIIYHVETKDKPEFDCPICLETISGELKISSSCNHAVCVTCMIEYLKVQCEHNREPSCSYCRQTIVCLETVDNETFDTFSVFMDNFRQRSDDIANREEQYIYMMQRTIPLTNRGSDNYPNIPSGMEIYDASYNLIRRTD
jgi:transcription elongation factor Elf1